ncbi:EGF-like domain-containing protein [Plasmodiophora brassicae]
MPPASPPIPTAVITAPSSSSYCDTILVSGIQSSSPDYGALVYVWNTSLGATIPNQPFFYLTNLSANASHVDVDLAVVSTFLGGRSPVTRTRIKIIGLPVPSVSISGTAQQQIYATDSLLLEAVAQAATCARGNAALSYLWTVTGGVPLSTSAAAQRILRLPGGTLAPGTTYTFAVLVSMQSNAALSATTTVNVTTLASPLVLRLSGSGSYITTRAITLDASQTKDPNGLSPDLLFAWTCQWLDTNDGITYTVPMGPCPNATAAFFSTTKSTVTIAANAFSGSGHSNYRVTVTATAPVPANPVRTVTGHVDFQVSEPPYPSYNPPSVAITPLSVSKVDPVQPLVLQATVTSFVSTTAPTTLFWTCNDPALKLGSKSVVLTSVTNPVLKLAGGVLNPYQSYTFTVMATDSGGTSYASITFVVNAPPRGGILVCSPSSGQALSTSFLLLTQSWNDDSSDFPLTYTFSYFNDAIGAEAPLGGGVQSASTSVSTILSPGVASKGYVIRAFVRAVDNFGAVSQPATCNITVKPPVLTNGAAAQAFFQTAVIDSINLATGSADTSKVLDIITAGAGLLNSLGSSASAVMSSLQTSLINALVSVSSSSVAMSPSEVSCKASALQAITADASSLTPSTASTALNFVSSLATSASLGGGGLSPSSASAIASTASSLMDALLTTAPSPTPAPPAPAPGGAPTPAPTVYIDPAKVKQTLLFKNVIGTLAQSSLLSMEPGEQPKVMTTKQFNTTTSKVLPATPIHTSLLTVPTSATSSIGGPVGVQSTVWASNIYAYNGESVCGGVTTVAFSSDTVPEVHLSNLTNPLAIQASMCAPAPSPASGQASSSCPGLIYNGTDFVHCNGVGRCDPATNQCLCDVGFSGPACLSQTVCVWFNSTTQAWSTDGCYPVANDLGDVSCHCNHATDFTTLVAPFVPKVAVPDTKSLELLLEGKNLNYSVIAIVSVIVGCGVIGAIWGRVMDLREREQRQKALEAAGILKGSGAGVMYFLIDTVTGLQGTSCQVDIHIGQFVVSATTKSKKLLGGANFNQVVAMEITATNLSTSTIVIDASSSDTDAANQGLSAMPTKCTFELPLKFLTDGELHAGTVTSVDGRCTLKMDCVLGVELKPRQRLSLWRILFDFWCMNHSLVSVFVFRDNLSMTRPQRIFVLMFATFSTMVLSALFVQFENPTWQQKVGISVSTAVIQMPSSYLITYLLFLSYKYEAEDDAEQARRKGIVDRVQPAISYKRYTQGLARSFPLLANAAVTAPLPLPRPAPSHRRQRSKQLVADLKKQLNTLESTPAPAQDVDTGKGAEPPAEAQPAPTLQAPTTEPSPSTSAPASPAAGKWTARIAQRRALTTMASVAAKDVVIDVQKDASPDAKPATKTISKAQSMAQPSLQKSGSQAKLATLQKSGSQAKLATPTGDKPTSPSSLAPTPERQHRLKGGKTSHKVPKLSKMLKVEQEKQSRRQASAAAPDPAPAASAEAPKSATTPTRSNSQRGLSPDASSSASRSRLDRWKASLRALIGVRPAPRPVQRAGSVRLALKAAVDNIIEDASPKRQGSTKNLATTGLKRQNSGALRADGAAGAPPQHGLRRQGSSKVLEGDATGLQRQGSTTEVQKQSSGTNVQGQAAVSTLKRQGSSTAASPQQVALDIDNDADVVKKDDENHRSLRKNAILVVSYAVLFVFIAGEVFMLLWFGAYFDDATANAWITYVTSGILQKWGVIDNLPLVKLLKQDS